MPTIRQLPPSVVNKIAAGEVIERPASVVKELLENAVDSGATRIDVTVEQGGAQLVRVSDNGCGIEPDQLLLAVASHATSKLVDADDLFRVRTLGFRGEALASIAEVSRLRLRSRTAETAAGAELEVVGGNRSDVAPCSGPVGTTIEVRDLFFNTPVRRKFLRATQTELGHTQEAFTRIALVYSQVHFTLRHGERTLFDLPPVERWRERITAFFGHELDDSLIWVESDGEGGRLSGYVADPSVSRANNRMQFLFLNGRHIRDRSLQHALAEAYRGLLLTGRFPVCFLHLELPPESVDVNVHPTKLEVRFQDGGRVYSQLLGTLRQRFLKTDLTAKVRLNPAEAPEPATSDPDAAPTVAPAMLAGALPAPSLLANDPAGIADPAEADRHRRDLLAWARNEPAPTLTGAPATLRAVEPSVSAECEPDSFEPAALAGTAPAYSLVPPASPPQQHRLPLTFERLTGATPEFRPFPDYGATLQRVPRESLTPQHASPVPTAGPSAPRPFVAPSATPAAPGPRAPVGMQLHDRYLVTQEGDAIVIIDQHALHERVLYEQIRTKVLSGEIETQRLLVPEPVTLAPAEAAAVNEARPSLAQLGIEVEPFGGDTVVVSSYPAMLANINPGEMLRRIVEQLLEAGRSPDRRDLLDELLHTIACKAAVKAGDRLTADEVTALLEHRHICQDAHHCPHGRPTALVFTRDELDKRFKRT